MKKAVVFALLFVWAATLAHSQVLIALLLGDKLNSDKFELGVRLAGNFQSLANIKCDSRFSIGFGVYGILKLNEKLSLQPELLFKDPRGAAGLLPETFGNADLDPLLADASVTMKLSYVTLPVLLKYSLTPQLSLGCGPQIGFLTGATNVYVAEVFAADDLVFKDKIKPALNDLDFALAFNLEYKLMRQRAIRIGFRYYLGLTDIFKTNPGEPVKNSVFQINLSIPLGGKAKAK